MLRSRCEEALQASSRLGSIRFEDVADVDAAAGDDEYEGEDPRRARFEGGRDVEARGT